MILAEESSWGQAAILVASSFGVLFFAAWMAWGLRNGTSNDSAMYQKEHFGTPASIETLERFQIAGMWFSMILAVVIGVTLGVKAILCIGSMVL